MHLPSTYLTQPHDILGAPTTNILTLFPRWLPLVVIFVVSRETLFGMNLSIISALSGIVNPCALLENDDSAWIQRCRDDHRMVKNQFLKNTWWSQTGSNRRPQHCQCCALPTELWPHNRIQQALRGATVRILPNAVKPAGLLSCPNKN